MAIAYGYRPPALTTVRQPLEEMGRRAARTVLTLARRRSPDSRRVELSTELMVRASTAPVPSRSGHLRT
ncbi:substrate-binding domain-containing protein [Actinoplanes sp. NPDC026619]|uniref:substrate-binding domain-containing protein n=1 Tax=Actinoplanes sp. NPDC026619 TaxID=3155798 RepID=UPI003400238F